MTVSEQIIQVINVLCEKFGIAVDWTSENITPYVEVLCKKLVTYEIATSSAIMLIMILLSIASIVATKKLAPIFKEKMEDLNDWDISGWELGAVIGILAVVGINIGTFVTVIVQTMDIIKCATFPEMYIFEYITMLVQGQ